MKLISDASLNILWNIELLIVPRLVLLDERTDLLRCDLRVDINWFNYFGLFCIRIGRLCG